jgi:hypothetical protein
MKTNSLEPVELAALNMFLSELFTANGHVLRKKIKKMNYPAAEQRGIKKLTHMAIMCAPRGGEFDPNKKLKIKSLLGERVKIFLQKMATYFFSIALSAVAAPWFSLLLFFPQRLFLLEA